VVSLDFGCGAHSEAAVVPATHPTSEPVVDEYVYDTVTFGERVVLPETEASQAAEAAAAAVVEAVPASEAAEIPAETPAETAAQAEADAEGITEAAAGVEETAVEEPVDES